MRRPSKSTPKRSAERGLFAIAIGAAIGLLVVVPVPYYIVAPGHAVDLGTRVTVEGRAASRARFYLTDVTVARATLVGMLARFLPATDVVPKETIMPAHESTDAFDRAMVVDMAQSQNVAGFVAERAAGYPVRDDFILTVAGFADGAPARGVLRENDRIVTVGGRAVRSTTDIQRAVALSPANAAIPVAIERDGKREAVSVAPVAVAGAPKRLGIYVNLRLPAVDLPVPVRFAVDDISGASAGLLFALQIYDELRPITNVRAIAGTGTLSPDGSVGPILGTRQKLEAARRVGATIFFVPKKNYADIASEAGGPVKIVPVTTFAQAVAYLEKG
jgi:PDZ domain-containing protein